MLRPEPSGPPVHGSRLTAPALAASFSLLVVLFVEWGPDWPAQQFRATFAVQHGLLAWTDQWYGGQALPGYSVLYPALARLIGASGVGLLATTAGAWAVTRLIPSDRRLAHHAATGVFVLTMIGNLIIGQVPFLLGTALGVLALVTLRGRHWWLTAALAAACSLASPLSGAFLLMIAVAAAAALGWRRSSRLLPALAGIVASEVVGGASGPFPCRWTALVGVTGFCLAVLVVADPAQRVLRRAAVLYAAATVVSFLIPNPIGGNIDRLGKLAALPVACYLVLGAGRRLVRPGLPVRGATVLAASAALAALAWALVPVGTAMANGAADPSRSPAYYRGLLQFLSTQPSTGGRLEIPFTREHWEAALVAPAFPLARGWERQTDLQYNSVLYAPLSAASYRDWLENDAVSLVALPSVPLDDGGKAEGVLLAHAPSYLTPVWHDANWTVWAVHAPSPIVTGAATMDRTGPASFRLTFARPGTATVRIRYSPLWQITDATGCIASSPDGWLEVSSATAGRMTLRARLNFDLVHGAVACTTAPAH